jgi:hypothetical protein
MDKFGIEDESWFMSARHALSQRGFTLRIQPKSIVVEHPTRLPRIFGSSREMLEFAQKQGVHVSEAAFTIADLYGDGTSPPVIGRRTDSQFETPPDLIGGSSQAEAGRVAQDYLLEAERRAVLEAEVVRLRARAEEAEKQCALWQLFAAAAEDRASALQAVLETGAGRGGADRRFEALRRFLARELHPDLAGSDMAARAVREEIFKRVWAKIEELQ